MKRGKKLSFDELLLRLKSVLKENNLKNTAQREIILKALLENEGHLSSDEVHAAANKLAKDAQIGKATVYRTLNFFEKEGFVSSISFGIDGKKYELDIKEHHDHMICVVCDGIAEFVSQEIEDIQEKIAKENGFLIKHHAMQLYGVCRKCSENKKGKK